MLCCLECAVVAASCSSEPMVPPGSHARGSQVGMELGRLEAGTSEKIASLRNLVEHA